MTVLNELRDEINDTMSDITKNIADLKKILDSNDVYRNSEYKSNIAKFKTQSTTSKRNVSLPIFTFQMINTDELFKKFGSLLALSKMESILPAEISALDRPLLVYPRSLQLLTLGIYLFNCNMWLEQFGPNGILTASISTISMASS